MPDPDVERLVAPNPGPMTLEGTNTYRITPDGQRVAVFYTKIHNRLLVPLLAADQPPAPPDLRQALRTIDRHVDAAIDHARLPRAA